MKENILTLQLRNKKATDKVLSVYWFAILFIVAIAIVYMAILFYGKPYDVREIEANLLINKIADCVAQGGRLNKTIWDNLNDGTILQSCKLNFNVEEFKDWKNDQHYININFRNFAEPNFIEKVKAGNSELNDNCDLKGSYMPICIERSFYVLDSSGGKVVIQIKSVIGKADKNVQ